MRGRALAPAMVRLWLLYDDAALDRQKVVAMFAGFITRPPRTTTCRISMLLLSESPAE